MAIPDWTRDGGHATLTIVDDYKSWLTAGGARPNTLRARLEGLSRLLQTTAHGDPLQLTSMDVTRWIATVNTAWSRATYYGHAAAWCRFLQDQQLPCADFMRGVPRPKAKLGVPRPIDANELAAAMSVSDASVRMMFRLAAWAGLRINEIAAVRGENVDQHTLYVIGKGGDQQVVPTHPLIWLEAADMPLEGWWFPSREGHDRHVHKNTVWRKMHRALIQVGSRATPHQCRHYYGTTLLDQGANIRVVQELLRHATVTSTQIYTRVRDEDRRRAINALPDVQSSGAA